MTLEIALTGRLASMNRDEAVRRIRSAGHVVVEEPGPDTAMLVVGEGGPPIGEDGRVTAPLRRARALQAQGHAIDVVTESQWLVTQGIDAVQSSALRSAAQVAALLDVPRAAITRWVRDGLLRPARRIGRMHLFSFRGVGHARAVKSLLAAGVSVRQLRTSLTQLAMWLPHDDVGAGHLDAARGGYLVVTTDDGHQIEADGQLQLPFDAVAGIHETAVPLESARTLFEQAVDAEAEACLDEARVLYERSIALDGPEAASCFNLGNVLHAQGDDSGAAARFREAVSIEPDYAEAWNNLGNALGALGETEGAIAAFECALAQAPAYADAHYNMAQTLQESGHATKARRHWEVYLSLDPDSDWADVARAALNRSASPPPANY